MFSDAGGNSPASSIRRSTRYSIAEFPKALAVCDIGRLMPLASGVLELLPQPLPALEVLMIKLRSLQRKLRRLAHKPSLEHERQGVAKIERLQFRLARPLKCFGVGPVTRHAIVHPGPRGHESFRLGIILTANQPHKLIHEVAMEPRRTKRVLGNHPSRRENDKVNIGRLVGARWCR